MGSASDDLLTAFVEGFRPGWHATAGAKPTHFDISLSAEDIRKKGEDLLKANNAEVGKAVSARIQEITAHYEKVQAERAEENAALRAQVAELTALVLPDKVEPATPVPAEEPTP